MVPEFRPWLQYLKIWRSQRSYEFAVERIMYLEACLELSAASH